MKSITFILPLHEYKKEYETYLTNCLNSIDNISCEENKNLIVVGPENATKHVSSIYNIEKRSFDITLLNNNNVDFFEQVNLAVDNCKSEYFSVIEFDDIYYDYWVSVCEKEMENGTSVIIPINELRNANGDVLSLANEVAWSPSFSDELGVLNVESLTDYMDFNVTGALIRTEDFKEIGKLKPSLKIASWYEFLLRACYNSKRVYVNSKIGYIHTVGRDGSYMNTSNAEIDMDYGKWLIDTARQEYFFNEDRKKEYVKDNEGTED